MFRYLPIVMLAFGLVLVSASFASAASLAAPASVDAQMCLAAPADPGTAQTGEPKAERCWKKIGLGLFIPGCEIYAQIPRSAAIDTATMVHGWPVVAALLIGEDAPPLLDFPPPRA